MMNDIFIYLLTLNKRNMAEKLIENIKEKEEIKTIDEDAVFKLFGSDGFIPRNHMHHPITGVVLYDGEACGHRGCLSHKSHPCEGCGRIGGITECPD